MLKKLYSKFLKWLYPEITYMIEKFDENHVILNSIHDILEDEMNLIEKELIFYKSLSEQTIKESPDMVWLKDLNGKYILANDEIKKDLLCSCDVEGKTDVELAKQARDKFGAENHTFGELCANSDKIVIDHVHNGTWGNCKDQGRFYEYGKVRGKMLYLEVNKFPVFIKDEFYGVAGFGRDLTPYVEAWNTTSCTDCGNRPDIFKLFEFSEREEDNG
jgi:hypothetical protein